MIIMQIFVRICDYIKHGGKIRLTTDIKFYIWHIYDNLRSNNQIKVSDQICATNWKNSGG